jgi:hypothetical protein
MHTFKMESPRNASATSLSKLASNSYMQRQDGQRQLRLIFGLMPYAMQMIFTTQLQTRRMGAHLWNDSAALTSVQNSDPITPSVVQCMHYKISCREERQYQNGTNEPNLESAFVHHHDMQAQSI